MGRTATSKVEIVLERADPPPPASEAVRQLLDQVQAVRDKNDGEWYKIAVVHSATGASGRKNTLLKRPECADVEFQAVKEGVNRSALFVRTPIVDDDETRAEEIEARRRQRREAAAAGQVPMPPRKPI